ncbi:MAG: hypothetical protein ACMUEK_03365 [Sodalis sp. (in: enterobacteria)]
MLLLLVTILNHYLMIIVISLLKILNKHQGNMVKVLGLDIKYRDNDFYSL